MNCWLRLRRHSWKHTRTMGESFFDRPVKSAEDLRDAKFTHGYTVMDYRCTECGLTKQEITREVYS